MTLQCHETDQAGFERWLARMDEGLEEFMARLPESVRVRLDRTVGSLDVLEAWLLMRYPTMAASEPESEAPILDGASRYIGETYRTYLGGHWTIALDDPRYVYHALPRLSELRSGALSECPLTMATASLERRRGDFISRFVRIHLDILSGKQPPRPPSLLEMVRRHDIESNEQLSFKHWLTLMDSALAELFADMPASLTSRLDHSAESLDLVESWLLERYADARSARADEAVLTLDGVSRYVGETLRRLLDGAWWFDLDGWSHNGLPEIGWPGHNADTWTKNADTRPEHTVCPLALVHAVTEHQDERRDKHQDEHGHGHVLRSVLPGG